jgi:hypothetical protein
MPTLPAEGPVRVVAILGSVALAAFLAGASVLAVRREGREARWAFALVVLGVVAGILGRAGAGWHAVATALVVSLALRNITCTHGAARWLTAAGLATWVAVMMLARRLFH